MNKLITIDNLHRYNENIQTVIDFKVQKLMTDTELKFFCIEPVTVTIRGESTTYNANTLVDIFLKANDEFEIIPTSNKSIASLYAWPGALGTYYEWLEGVNLFDGVLFNMNNEDLYTKWSQGNQGLYHVQFAQYKNCIFWSDLSYVSDVARRTNYTLYYSSELPLCYSSIPDNTFKAFYFAYNVTCDPNWSNPVYKESFANANWATQVFSYYGLHSIGIFDWDSPQFNIVLPKDCRGLMYYAPNVLNAGVFDAINTTNFGAKSGSWRDAFAHCYQLTNLYIKNLKANLNISWSPINQQSLNFILSKAANTNAITIYLSPHTYYGLTDANKQLATEKNITLSLISTNTAEDNRLQMIQMTGDGTKFLANDGSYKEIGSIPTKTSELTNDSGFITANDNVASATKLQTMRYINGSPFDGTANAVSYAVCATGASTTAKTVSISRFSLATGSQVRVKFSNANTASAPTLNVGSTGAKRMSYKGNLITNTNFTFNINKIYTFTYDGTYWVIEGDWDSAKKQDTLVSGTNIKTINGQSLLGSGDITVQGGGSSEGGSSAYAEVNHGTSDTSFALTPNTFHVWDEVASLDLSLGAKTLGVANEYLFQFASGSIPTTLTLPDNIKFSEDLVIEANKIYQISILKGLGSVLSWDIEVEIDTTPIIFYINNENQFNAEAWMTWADFIASDYNTNVPSTYDKWFRIENGMPEGAILYEGEVDNYVSIIDYGNYTVVTLNDKIKNNYNYMVS